MKKLKYYYNPKTLNYEMVEVSWHIKALRVAGWVSTAIVFATILLAVYYSFFKSPREFLLERENEKLALEMKLAQEELHKLNEELNFLARRDENIYRVIFEADPISGNVREAGYGGRRSGERFRGYKSEMLLKTVDSLILKLKHKLVVQSKSYDEIEKMATSKEKMLAHIPAIQPVSNEDLTRFASGFGYRIHPIYKTVKFHAGADFTAPRGAEVYATGDGKVIKSDNKSRGYGNQIVIDHGYGYKTRYAHLQAYHVKAGDYVKRGELIGFVGSTGLSTAPHLHYEVLKNGNAIDPVNFFYNDLTSEEYDQLIDIANRTNQSFD